MDINYLNELIIPIVLVACLILGYIIKKWLPTDNKYIPTILAIVGAVLGCVAMKDITLDIVVGGALTGLASTGLHQLFTQYIEKKDKTIVYDDVVNFDQGKADKNMAINNFENKMVDGRGEENADN